MHGSSYLSSLPALTVPAGMHLRKQVSVRECIAINFNILAISFFFYCFDGFESGGFFWEKNKGNHGDKTYKIVF